MRMKSGLAERLVQDGGFTLSTVTGEEPKKGFVVSPYPEKSFAKGSSELTEEDVAEYVRDNNDLLSLEDHFLGGWNDEDTARAFLDVSIIKQDQNEAIDLALERDQIAIFDLSSFEEITVNRQATSGGVAV